MLGADRRQRIVGLGMFGRQHAHAHGGIGQAGMNPRQFLVDDEAGGIDDHLAPGDARPEHIAENRESRCDGVRGARHMNPDGTRQHSIEIQAEDEDVGRVVEVVGEQARLIRKDRALP